MKLKELLETNAMPKYCDEKDRTHLRYLRNSIGYCKTDQEKIMVMDIVLNILYENRPSDNALIKLIEQFKTEI